ncbi:MAG: ABC transporter ATP-binding protein [Lachnospiraceae bacterium]|nr:ABC transporter ATP-binding protein [Lachnospiraceae bacterium]
MYRECVNTVKGQLKKEAKANKGINKKHTLRRLLKYLFKQPWLILLAIALTITSNVLELTIPKLSGQAVDVVAAGVGAVQFDVVMQYCIQIIVLIVISCILAYLLTVIMSFITRRILSSMRRDMFNRLLHLPVSYYDTHAAGDVISKITYDVSTINTSLSSDVITLASSVVTVVGSFIMMVSISPILVLIFAVTIPATMIYTKKLSGIVRPLFRARSGKLGELNGFIEEMISGQKTIKAYNRELYTISRFQKQNETAVDAYYKSDYMAAFNGPSVMMISNISQAMVTMLGAALYLFNMISLGNISSFVQYSRRFSGPINESANIISELQSALAASERVFRVLDEAEEAKLSENEGTLTAPTGDVRFEHVSFRYVPEKPILTDVSLRAEPGKVTAIVGPTGAGKTTIISLLMRFYDINEGQILIDGTETREFTRDSVRKAFAMVLQDTWLFTGTVFENVAYGNENATLEDVIRVCKAAYIHNYIMRLPDQYNTVLTDDGTNISKGQKQLLTIARAMLLDAHMLILDEATSNVDTRTEIELQKAMLELMKGKTCFIIAHRLSTIRNADNILVVRDGQVIEQGTHDALMTSKGFYYNLYEAQWSKGEEI